MDTICQAWAAIQNFLGSIPDVIWSGVIASALTLGGVLVSNSSNTRRLKDQLDHDASQKEKDRLAALRREVYLRAPLEATAAISYISGLANRDLATIGEDEGIKGYAEVAAQIGILSELSTVKAAGDLAVRLNDMIVWYLSNLQPVQDARVDLGIARRRLDAVFGEIFKLQAERQQRGIEGESDGPRVAGIDFWIRTRMDESQSLRLEIDQLSTKFEDLSYRFQAAAVERWKTVLPVQVAAMSAFRKEIGLSHDLEGYKQLVTEQYTEAAAKMLALLKDLATDRQPPNGELGDQ